MLFYFKLVIKFTTTKTTVITTFAVMLIELVTLQFTRHPEAYWTFVAYVRFYTTVHT